MDVNSMQWIVKRSTLTGTIEIPPSKSHTLRAILFALMAKGKSTIRHFLASPDSEAMIKAVVSFGAKVSRFPDHLEIEGLGGNLKCAEDVIDCQNSGQVLRFIGAISSLTDRYTILTGDQSIRHNRPILPLLQALEKLDAMAVSSRLDGYAPIIIKGPLRPGKTSLNGQDSQPVSGLLIALSFAKGASIVDVQHPGEKPWIDLTLSWFDRLGIKYKNDNYERYELAGNASYNGFNVEIPGDFSTSAFPIAAAILSGSEVTLKNLDRRDVQGDKKFIHVLKKMGALIEEVEDGLQVKKGSTLKGMKIDVNDFIDSVPILAVLGCFAEGKTEIVNAAIARQKECDRLHAITTELKKMGANIEEKEDSLIIHPSKLKGAKLHTYHDHRMVMALTVAAMQAEGESVIEGVDAVKKTYPSFLEDFNKLGARIEPDFIRI
ncbi:MAG TPA: 3-phosphoshikimate 1-carboxyvinyltransferase [Chlamydiales bacterium]|nr:3-phosphoshikimate 1-carboxyvinyltransferase [Chlamydiales bacterium]